VGFERRLDLGFFEQLGRGAAFRALPTEAFAAGHGAGRRRSLPGAIMAGE
jgi:hypothetical protein